MYVCVSSSSSYSSSSYHHHHRIELFGEIDTRVRSLRNYYCFRATQIYIYLLSFVEYSIIDTKHRKRTCEEKRESETQIDR